MDVLSKGVQGLNRLFPARDKNVMIKVVGLAVQNYNSVLLQINDKN